MPPPLPPEEGLREAATLRPAWLTVDLDALRRNLALLTARLRPAGRIAVVKANAYGHGAVEIARTLAGEGIEWLAVALVEEGAELRRAGVATPMLMLGTALPSQLPFFAKYDLTPTVSSLEQLVLWREWTAGALRPQPIHLKIDTGMTRLGISFEQAGRALALVRESRGLELAGVMSHLAEADDLASPRTPLQERRFSALLAELAPDERGRVVSHLANSAAALHRPLGEHDLVRLGLALYGVDPARALLELEPVLTASARIVQIREVEPGTRAGYGGRWRARRHSRVAVVPVGYADGYSWRLGGRSEALVGGRRVAVVGSVSMDMLLLDVTDVPAAPGDEVVLLGRQGSETISVHELADWAGTIAYEILCLLSQRLPRRYAAGGQWVACRSRHVGGGR